tara:strand:+ start:746 stop:1705 length:960 start_codon:yes stop_codon:yes gene_type:complete
MTKTKLSVVVPLYNEDSNINILYKEIKKVLQKLNKEYEIIFVDDGSTDKGYEKLQEIYNSSEHVKIIKFRRNFGQSAAICAGFFNSKGEVIIVMDADLQNDPRDILKLLDKLNEGYDLVSGWRFNRNDPFSKRLSSKLANWMHKKLTGLKIHDSGCTLKAYKRESIKNLNLFGEMHRYIPALINLKGFKISEVKVNHRSRKYGRTKYGMSRLVHGFLDLLYIKFWSEFSTRPLHFFGYLGIIPIIIGLIIGIIKVVTLIILFLNNEPVVVAPLLLFAVFLIIVGILFIIFGFLAEMNVRMNYSQTNQQKYEIEKILSKS